jgi:hypothetical protein
MKKGERERGRKGGRKGGGGGQTDNNCSSHRTFLSLLTLDSTGTSNLATAAATARMTLLAGRRGASVVSASASASASSLVSFFSVGASRCPVSVFGSRHCSVIKQFV